jgi:hypothetical protein
VEHPSTWNYRSIGLLQCGGYFFGPPQWAATRAFGNFDLAGILDVFAESPRSRMSNHRSQRGHFISIIFNVLSITSCTHRG